MNTNEELLVYKLSSGENWAVVPIGFRERILCFIKNDAQLEEILRIWRSGDIWASIKIRLLNYRKTYLLQQGENVSLVKAKLPGLPMMQQMLLVERIGTTRNYGYAIDIKKFSLNIPREKSASVSKEKGIIQLQWEILPPGWWRTWKPEIGVNASSQRHYYGEIERLRFLDKLNPERWYAGKNYLGKRIYYVAVFKNCVVAESAAYGNAAYFVFEVNNWRTILSRTKRDVLQLNEETVLRIAHVHNWQSRFTRIIAST
jgi:hypothetical protein